VSDKASGGQRSDSHFAWRWRPLTSSSRASRPSRPSTGGEERIKVKVIADEVWVSYGAAVFWLEQQTDAQAGTVIPTDELLT